MTGKHRPQLDLIALLAISLNVVLALAADPALAQRARYSESTVEPYLSDDVKVITPQAQDKLSAFRVPSLHGHLRMGIPNNYADAAAQTTMGGTEILARRRGMFIKNSGAQLYMDLLTLGENREILTAENLKMLYTNARRPLQTDPMMTPLASVLVRAARGGLSDTAYREVFCVKDAPCPLDQFNGTRPYDIAGQTPIWGGAYNEFRFRAAYQAFVAKYAQALIDWGSQLERAVSVVGTTRVSTYDFSQNAYVLRVEPGTRMKAPAEGLQDFSSPDYDLTFDIRDSSGEIASLTVKWKVSRDQAEAFRNELTARKINKLYTVMDGELAFDEVDRVAMQNAKYLKQNTYVALTANQISLYFDADLTEEAMVFKLR